MSKDKKRMEFYAGVPWVNITPEQARNHPKGKPGVILWAIALYFIVTGLWKFYAAWDFGLAGWLVVLAGIWPFLAGVGLLMRVPWSVFMAIVSAGLTVWALFRSSRATAELYNSFEGATQTGFLHALFGVDGYTDGFFVILLVELLIQVGILFYLMDGDRPNLIYRHRYRQYSANDGGGDA
ncbi:hypothetical protein [Pseudooctadecabacter sp.]|uniref:hypothetical protein n=1 Tax=Pseudooctadecabacter sp. TaxID=1966338 RepID=UPI0035C8683A